MAARLNPWGRRSAGVKLRKSRGVAARRATPADRRPLGSGGGGGGGGGRRRTTPAPEVPQLPQLPPKPPTTEIPEGDGGVVIGHGIPKGRDAATDVNGGEAPGTGGVTGGRAR